MKKRTIFLASLASLTLSWSAMAAELMPSQAGTFALGDHIASVYYTEHDEIFEVVTTIAPAAELEGAPVRFVGSLALGETQTISVGEFDPTVLPHELELVHDGDYLLATMTTAEVAAH